MRPLAIVTSFTAIMSMLVFPANPSHAKGGPEYKHSFNASQRSAMQHWLNAEHPKGQVRALDEHMVNQIYKNEMPHTAPPFARKGAISPGMAKKGFETGGIAVPQSSGMARKEMELLEEQNKHGLGKGFEKGILHGKKGW
ncbi:MAG: hypothetical protein C5B53_04440 [Candidatus Melainabacteria bacterium]|nr:MAG: hypothetical protein C5B53_04440 [Candidatus Melainabacteria bacterium]